VNTHHDCRLIDRVSPYADIRDDDPVAELDNRIDARLRLAQVSDPRDLRVLTLRLGLDGGGDRTLDEVSALCGVTRERVRQIEMRAIRRIQHEVGNDKRKLLAVLRSHDGRTRAHVRGDS